MTWQMCYCTLRLIGSGSSACMQCWNPCHQPKSGNTGEGAQAFPTCHIITLSMAYTCTTFLPLHSFPSWVAQAAFTATAFSTVISSNSWSVSIYFRPLAHQVPHSHIGSGSQAKLHEGLQHNTCRVYQCEQGAFQSFCDWYHLTAFPASEDTWMVFMTYLDEHMWQFYTMVHHHLAAICLAHIALGLPNPLEDCSYLQQLLHAIQRQQSQPQPDLGHQGITTDFLCIAKCLHHPHLPRDRVLWAALTMGYYSLFFSSKLAQPKLAKAGAPHFIHVQDITPHFSRGCLHYICVFLASSKMDPFHLGCPIITGCTGTPVCSACEAWHLLQQHQWTQTSWKPPSSR